MHLFINDIPVHILEPGKRPDAGHINYSVDARKEAITKAKLINHTWINNCDTKHFDTILDLVNHQVPIDLLSLYITATDYNAIKLYLKKKFTVVKAAGGLLVKKDRFLMINRLKKWDLPKGKKDSDERYTKTATREINEECNIKSKVGKKICTTWHTYTMNKRNMLKKTRWYLMQVVDDSKMKPQTSEAIEELRWMNRKEVYLSLDNSYKSIRFVFEEYYRKMDKLV